MNNLQDDIERYLAGQAESGIRRGDKVRVMARAESYTHGWECNWVDECMDCSIGEVLDVLRGVEYPGTDYVGILLSDNYCYPYFVLSIVSKHRGNSDE